MMSTTTMIHLIRMEQDFVFYFFEKNPEERKKTGDSV